MSETPSNDDRRITLADVRAAAARIESHVHRTPVMRCTAIDERAGRAVAMKCELFQKIGAFKIRGATNAVLLLDDEEASHGVVGHSSGNHAQALALAARTRGIPATIVMPSDANAAKRRAVLAYGARVVDCEPTQEAREATCAEIAERTGATIIPPFDHRDVIAGQGTIALELLEQAPEIEAVVVPIGGGGMISGIATVVKALRPDVLVIGAEPSAADDAARSRAAGRRLPPSPPVTVADGLRTGLSDRTFDAIVRLVDEIVTVEEAAIVDAMRFTWERAKLPIEPSAAVGVAAVFDDAFRANARLDAMRSVAVILCGGNVDLDALPW